MINLIPPSAQSQVKREYWIRVISVWLFLLGFACITVATLNVPVYVLLKNQLGSLENEYAKTSTANQSFKESEQAMVSANAISKLLTSANETTPFMEVINELRTLAGAGVAIEDFNLIRTEGVISSITITGEADSRLLLSEFQQKLEKNPTFANAKLPLSNLAKDKDIPFTITIVRESAKETVKKP